MKDIPIYCAQCNTIFYRSQKRINEAKKIGWKQYCSITCQIKSKSKQRLVTCSNPHCHKTFTRPLHQLRKVKKAYCSQSCAAIVNNAKFPKHPGFRKICPVCQVLFVSREKYCSIMCKNQDQIIPDEIILKRIKEFYKQNGRIPFKREFHHARIARERFSTWNKAIKAAGFTANPVMFAKKYLAHDGHKCDSLAEKIIDDWLFTRKIFHQRSYPYPGNHGLTVDFVIGDFWVEYFGLYGGHKRYDELHNKKLQLAKYYDLKLVEVYPKHLFPVNKLSEVLASIIR